MRVRALADITFSEIMEFYPEHNRSVYEDLKRDCKAGRLIPFVGAGLSAFCGYQSWTAVLKDLAGYLFDDGIRTGVQSLIEAGELLQAAQDIHDHYPRMLKELQKMFDYGKIQTCSPSKLSASAAYVLPRLFPGGLVMTTNFDRVLEEVYDRSRAKFGNVLTPYDCGLLTQARQGNPHCLFKLHGDIGPEIHDIERLVLTKDQYDRAYAGPLMRELPQWFQSKRLLFLGCSLASDRTMEVLRQVTEEQPGLDHYAVLGCRPDGVQARCVEMGKLGISAIFYPDKRHEAVRAVLERLLEETSPSAYQELTRGAKRPGAERRFMYDSGYIPFVGRKDELARLEAFCEAPEPVSWWAVSGPGGMGKSRLVYEFTNRQREGGWEVLWLDRGSYGELARRPLPADRCIIVADDIQAHLQAVGDWIAPVLEGSRSEKLRILLLERDGKDLDSAKWTELLLADSPYDDTISSKCYRPDFLDLGPLQDGELKAIMMDFAEASAKPLADAGHADRLLQTLKNIDGDLRRPIYALAITDAWCGGKDPTRWNKEQVLDALIKRELKFYHDRLRALSTDGVSKEMRSELENLLARACARPFLPLSELADGEYPKLRKRADRLDLTFQELLQQIGAAHRIEVHVKIVGPGKPQEKTEILEAVVMNCPDLVKEHLVLWQVFEKRQTSLLFPENWDNDPMPLHFFGNILRDYPEKLEENGWALDTFLKGEPKSEFPAAFYSRLLFNISAFFPNMTAQAAERLEKLSGRFPDQEKIAVAYAKTLTNLSAKQSAERCVSALEKLTRRFSEQETIADAYARALVNLSADQSPQECVSAIEELTLRFPEQENIADAYATALVNLSADQPLDGCAAAIEKLLSLCEQFPENETLITSYTSGLVNLSFAQTEEDKARENVQQSREVLMRYPQNVEIQQNYAKTLFNLTLKQAPEALRQTADQLREFLLAHPEANQDFQASLDTYLDEHPEHAERYAVLRL